MASVYHINKGVNTPVSFKGLKAQYIWYLGGGIVGILIAFAILYICGLNMFVCLGIAFIAGGILFYRIYGLSNTYGEYGMLKKIGKRQIPKLVRSNSRKVFMQ
jgi:hypothetical protein